MLWQSASGVVRHAVSSRAKSPGPGSGRGGEGKGREFLSRGFARRTNLASEWNQMMFAEAGDVDFSNQDHFVMVFRKDSIIDHV